MFIFGLEQHKKDTTVLHAENALNFKHMRATPRAIYIVRTGYPAGSFFCLGGLPAGYLQAQTGQPAGYLQAALQALPGPKH